MLEFSLGDRACLYISATGPCTLPTIRAHSISKNAALARVARAGHVYQPNANPFRLLKSSGQITYELVGIGNASVFTGFCSTHDALIFRPIDQEELTPTKEQAFLLHYRALCKELYVKRASPAINEVMRDADKGKSIYSQQHIQEFVTARSIGINAALRELEQDKKECDRMLLAKEYNDFRGCAIRFRATPTLACAGLTQPVYDFAGSVLQEMSDIDKQLSRISFTLLPTATGGVASFGWLNDSDGVCAALITSFLSLSDENKSDGIVQLIFDSFENHVAQPDWWETLSDERKNELTLRLLNWTHPLVPIDTTVT